MCLYRRQGSGVMKSLKKSPGAFSDHLALIGTTKNNTQYVHTQCNAHTSVLTHTHTHTHTRYHTHTEYNQRDGLRTHFIAIT